MNSSCGHWECLGLFPPTPSNLKVWKFELIFGKGSCHTLISSVLVLLKEKAKNFLSLNVSNLDSPKSYFNATLLYILYKLSIKLVLGYNMILKINFQMNFSWLSTTWQSTFYGMLPKIFIIICVISQVRLSYMDQYTSLIMEVYKEERK